jgi:hypothetical protein
LGYERDAGFDGRNIGGIAQNTLRIERCPSCDNMKASTISRVLCWAKAARPIRGPRQRAAGGVPLALAGAIGMVADQDHPRERGDEGHLRDRRRMALDR